MHPPDPNTANRTGGDNADAHLKRQIMGREVVVAITNGQLDLGPWEQIFYVANSMATAATRARKIIERWTLAKTDSRRAGITLQCTAHRIQARGSTDALTAPGE
jgi:hypothetical protein